VDVAATNAHRAQEIVMLRHSRILGLSIAGAAFCGVVHADPPHDGYPDTDWGLFGSGKSIVPFDLGGDRLDHATGSAMGADGSLFISGTVADTNGTRRIGVAKLGPDGTLDTNFGNDGRVLSPAVEGRMTGMAMVRRNNTLYVGGYRDTQGASARDFAVCVFSTGGVPLNFLATGTSCVTVAFDIGVSKDDLAYDIAVQPDGKIVLAGTIAVNAANDTLAAFARLNSDGTLDASFGSGGRRILRTTNIFQRHRVRSVAIAGNGKIVAAGGTDVVGGTDASALVIRLNADGSDDPLSNTPELAFSVDGSPNRDTELYDLLLEDVSGSADDRIVVVGYTETAQNPTGSNRLIARLNPNGTFDATFSAGGNAGYTIFGAGPGASGSFESVAVQPGSGAYFAAGAYFPGGQPSDLVVCNIRSDGATTTWFEGFACASVDFSLPGEFEAGGDVLVQGDGVYLSGTGFKSETDGDFVAAKFTLDRIFADDFD
jgi:uncharacterized delta-60 repeat protein